jgi:hypothetical protein
MTIFLSITLRLWLRRKKPAELTVSSSDQEQKGNYQAGAQSHTSQNAGDGSSKPSADKTWILSPKHLTLTALVQPHHPHLITGKHRGVTLSNHSLAQSKGGEKQESAMECPECHRTIWRFGGGQGTDYRARYMTSSGLDENWETKVHSWSSFPKMGT